MEPSKNILALPAEFSMSPEEIKAFLEQPDTSVLIQTLFSCGVSCIDLCSLYRLIHFPS